MAGIWALLDNSLICFSIVPMGLLSDNFEESFALIPGLFSITSSNDFNPPFNFPFLIS